MASRKMKIVKILSMFLICQSGQTCNLDVSFKWKMDNDWLVFSCNVSQLKYRVKIVDPFNNVQAYCFPYPVGKCERYYKDSTIEQNTKTNITTFKVHGRIDKRVNGIWTCYHGTGRGASTDVNVLSMDDSDIKSEYLIKLTGPSTVYKDDVFWIYCESNTKLQKKAARFEINDINIDTIRFSNNTCYSTHYERVCDSQLCGCFGQGKVYTVRMVAQSVTGRMTVGCSMDVYRNGNPTFIFNCIDVIVIESPEKDNNLTTKVTKPIPTTTNKEQSTSIMQSESMTHSYTIETVETVTTFWNKGRPEQDFGFQITKKDILIASVIVGLMFILVISILAGCFCRKRLQCTMTIRNRDIQENNDPHYHSINETQVDDSAGMVSAIAPPVDLLVRRSNIGTNVLYFEVVPDIEEANSYESLRSDAEYGHHLYTSCPRIESFSSQIISSQKSDQQTNRKSNRTLHICRSKLHTI